MAPTTKSSKGKGKVTHKFIINASQPASDKIFDISAFEKFLQDKIKVDGRVGNLGDVVQISQVGDGKIEVIAHTQFSGRYLKYLYAVPFLLHAPLHIPSRREDSAAMHTNIGVGADVYDDRTKKFLKKQQLRDWLRVVSTSKGVYELRFFNVVNDADEDDDE
ncbi:ribosomal L22e family protein [Drepanopeziza brunnea f. sp. 'multigermtubi' MB_m1]|uniref:Ribosomal L22e family protein n=1 Tax=Marssonina brunnea f. sp. multigermtubi (strain MB_m1) TaxID=1072389 RepID=K1X8I5_MARBU|nr:ribosomal L22e family protein [Drepanopeziza brunnea f. sp. 'multigermtubi' MB_m1]EKD21372.1 ribosomal L22e family protein [Drepanopeziza brunnea f. sp. 'multigermtubi' MB_m1]